VIVAGLFSFSWTQAFDFPPEATRLDGQLREALDRTRAARSALAKADANANTANGPDDVSDEETDTVIGAEPETEIEVSPVVTGFGAEAASAFGEVDPGSFYEPSYRERLAVIVTSIVQDQGPLREDRLVQVVARLHGFKRAGREIRDRGAGERSHVRGCRALRLARGNGPCGMEPVPGASSRRHI